MKRSERKIYQRGKNEKGKFIREESKKQKKWRDRLGGGKKSGERVQIRWRDSFYKFLLINFYVFYVFLDTLEPRKKMDIPHTQRERTERVYTDSTIFERVVRVVKWIVEKQENISDDKK
jgi:hypothetical protein